MRLLPVWIAVAVVVVLAGAVYYFDDGLHSPNVTIPSSSPPPPPPSNFTVTATSVVYQPNACWTQFTGPGFTTHGGGTVNLRFKLANPTASTCVVNAASAVTRGFSLDDQNTPLTVLPLGDGQLNLTVQAPYFDVDQAIQIDLTVSVLN
jgi:hypothetical protein